MALELICLEFEDGERIPQKFTCDGENINPEFEISGVEDDVLSMVMIVDDLDSADGNFVHWMVWNIPPSTKHIVTGELPEDCIEGFNDFGNAEYGGPCPKTGTHRYQFKLYALDIDLEIDEDADRRALEREMAGHIVDEAVLTGVYGRE